MNSVLLAGDGHFSQVFGSYGCEKIVFLCWIHRGVFLFVFFLFSHSLSLSLSHTHTAPVNLWESVIYFNNGLILTGFSPRINCISPSLKAAGENHSVALFPKQNPADSSPSGGCLLEGLSACSSSKDFSLESLFLFVPFLCDSLNSAVGLTWSCLMNSYNVLVT